MSMHLKLLSIYLLVLKIGSERSVQLVGPINPL